jgi:hypothetical protein
MTLPKVSQNILGHDSHVKSLEITLFYKVTYLKIVVSFHMS